MARACHVCVCASVRARARDGDGPGGRALRGIYDTWVMMLDCQSLWGAAALQALPRALRALSFSFFLKLLLELY